MTDKFIKLNVNDENFAAKVFDIRELGMHVEISQSDYFKYTAAKNITAASFKILSRFFSGVDTEGNKIDFSSYKGKEISYLDMVSLIYKYPSLYKILHFLFKDK